MTTREQLEKLVSDFGLGYFISVEGNKVSLKTEESEEIITVTGTSEEDACKRIMEAVKVTLICAKLEAIFGDALAGVVIIKGPSSQSLSPFGCLSPRADFFIKRKSFLISL